MQKHLRHFGNITIKENITGIFNNSCKWIIDVPISAMDPQKAHTHAIKLINFFVSLLQYNNHRSKAYAEKRAIVVEKGSDRIYNLKATRTPLERGSVLSDEKNNEKIALMVKNFAFSPAKFTNVIELHSSAICSATIDNQLLNLWTIIEVLISLERKNNFSKINQICNTVTSIL